MSNAPQLPAPDTALVKQAIAWLIQLKSKENDQATLTGCIAWRQSSSEHELAWQRVNLMLGEMQQDLNGIPDGIQVSQVMQNTMRHMQKRRSIKLLALAAIAGSTALMTREVMPWQPWLSDYHTTTGERRSMMLADGSELFLNTDSSVNISFDEHQRLIILNQGEIMIKTGSDSSSPRNRPLRVQTRHAMLEAIGTQFVVRLQQDTTLLSMQQGKVSMMPAAFHAPQKIAEAGQDYLIYQDRLDSVQLPMEADSWTLGALVVKEMPLADFLAEVARYRTGHLGCDPSVADLRLSGVFQLDDIDKLLALLPHKLPVVITYRTRWWVNVDRRA
ncbi:FecR family protein [Methylobacillus gramineus]|uniref:FecR domain-containing protein n=1 Tax=Methylobacillus gramineus TaxID=755169 RepID=UPI001CFFB634|nr:FecR family protein [Methylobacillus gramineus]MCB5184638.1 FecR family protein [Methylobacillus gramineus]